MKLCVKCKGKVPSTCVIEGKRRNFSHRKFCLTCSPFGGHNTRKDDPSRPKKARKYKDFDENQKISSRLSVWEKGMRKKKELVDMKGGACKKCGYSRCLRALTFHHKDPSKKSFSLDTRNVRCTKWERLVEEVEKCELLCFNCHMEEHDEYDDKNAKYRNTLK